jgi:hypothetical protein
MLLKCGDKVVKGAHASKHVHNFTIPEKFTKKNTKRKSAGKVKHVTFDG